MSDVVSLKVETESVELRLLNAAEAILESEGPDSLSVRRIAKAAGVAPMGVYNHFEGKMGIIDALFRRGFARLGAAMSSLVEIENPLEALAEGGRRYRSLGLAHPMAYQLMFLRPVPGFNPSIESAKVATAAFEGLINAVRRAAALDLLRDLDAVVTAQILWASYHGWVALEICGLGFVSDVDAGAEALGAAIWMGIANPNLVINE